MQRCTIEPPSFWQDARRKTPNDLFSLPLVPSRALPPVSVSPSFPTSCLSCFAEAASSDSTFRLFYFPPSHSVLLRPLALFSARCSETLRLLAGGLASYAGCARGASCAETATNLRQFVFGIAP